MRVLITNQSLLVRGGAESFTRDLARQLNQRGHAVMAYGSDPARRERLLEIDPIPVTTEPGRLPNPPDIIHARNPLDALTVLAALPGTPVVYQVRADIWSTLPPIHPGIHHYLADTPSLAERLANHHHIPPEKISLCPEPVDLARFPSSVRLPPHPRKALWLAQAVDRPPDLQSTLIEFCRHHRIELDAGGPDFPGGNEAILPAYHLVFASGRHAREALACGCAVVLIQGDVVGDLVLPANIGTSHHTGFLPGNTNTGTHSDALDRAFASYHPAACAEATRSAQTLIGWETAIGNLLTVYEQVIRSGATSRFSPEEASRAVSSFLESAVPELMRTYSLLGRRFRPLPEPACPESWPMSLHKP